MKKRRSTRVPTKKVEEVYSDKIDDPVRMYRAMGEIPLLTREQEIELARCIEIFRDGFHKKG